MKVLVIDEWFPWPLESGKKIRTFNLISRLAKKHEILYMAYAKSPEDDEKMQAVRSHGITVLPVEDKRTPKWTPAFYFSVALNFLSSEPFSTRYHIREEFIREIRLVVERERPDLVHCEWTNLAPFLDAVEGIPCVISSHNVESDIWKRFGEHGSNIFKRILGRSQAGKIERMERYWYPRAHKCIAVSAQDQKVIEGYGARVALVDNGVDIGYYDAYAQTAIDDNAIIFTASFDTFSNQDGAEYFVRDIFPLIREKMPDMQLWLVGREPSASIRAFSQSDGSIHVTGTVDDVRQYIARSALCIVPLRIGGGSRLKILEAMAMKKAVISTSVGAEGLNVTHGKDILLADEPRLFSEYVIECLTDPSKRNSIAASGYSLVSDYYDWESLASRHEEVWIEVLEHGGSLKK